MDPEWDNNALQIWADKGKDQVVHAQMEVDTRDRETSTDRTSNKIA